MRVLDRVAVDGADDRPLSACHNKAMVSCLETSHKSQTAHGTRMICSAPQYVLPTRTKWPQVESQTTLHARHRDCCHAIAHTPQDSQDMVLPVDEDSP